MKIHVLDRADLEKAGVSLPVVYDLVLEGVQEVSIQAADLVILHCPFEVAKSIYDIWRLDPADVQRVMTFYGIIQERMCLVDLTSAGELLGGKPDLSGVMFVRGICRKNEQTPRTILWPLPVADYGETAGAPTGGYKFDVSARGFAPGNVFLHATDSIREWSEKVGVIKPTYNVALDLAGERKFGVAVSREDLIARAEQMTKLFAETAVREKPMRSDVRVLNDGGRRAFREDRRPMRGIFLGRDDKERVTSGFSENVLFSSAPFATDDDSDAEIMQQRAASMSASKVVLACRQFDGSPPPALYRAASAGRACVYFGGVESGYPPLPDGQSYDWVIRFRAKDALDAGSLIHFWLRSHGDDEIAELGRKARAAYESTFNPETWGRNLPRAIEQKLSQD